MSKLLKGLVVSVMLSAGAAFAAPHAATPVNDRGDEVQSQRRDDRDDHGVAQSRRHDDRDDRRGIQSEERARRFHRGHYETREIRQWVPGRWVTAYVPTCRVNLGCTTIATHHYERGHFVEVAQRVWVPAYVYG